MSINKLYHTWFQRIQELRPGQRINQIRNMVWLMIGIYQSRSVCLSRIAGKIPGTAKLLSTTRRLSRWLDNPAIRVREWYEPIAREWLETQFRNLGEIHLMVDGKIAATLGGNVDDLFGQTRRAQEAFEHILRISEELDQQDAPPALVGLKGDLNQTAVSYLEAARLTLRWLSTPTQANSEQAHAKLTEARASLTELEKSQWLQTT